MKCSAVSSMGGSRLENIKVFEFKILILSLKELDILKFSLNLFRGKGDYSIYCIYCNQYLINWMLCHVPGIFQYRLRLD